MSRADIRQFFSKKVTRKGDREPLYELQPEIAIKDTLTNEPKGQDLELAMGDSVPQKPCPKRKKQSENRPCPKSKKAKINPGKNMDLMTVFSAKDLLTSSSDNSSSVSRESSPTEVAGSKEISSEESDGEGESTDNDLTEKQSKTDDKEDKSAQDKNDSTASSANESEAESEDPEYEVEEVIDYKWCRATVNIYI